MPSIYSLLSLDMGLDDCLYRFRRDSADSSTVVYVHLQNLDLIPKDRSTYGPDIVAHFQETIKVWDQTWKTLEIYGEEGNIQYKQDTWERRYLDLRFVQRMLPRINVLHLQLLQGYKTRVSSVQYESRQCILKICPFDYQVPYFTQEMRIYNFLTEKGCSLQPRLLAYAFEGRPDNIMGFICEKLDGAFATPSNFKACKEALIRLHSFGIVHGDMNKFNIIMGTEPMFIDFEKTKLATDNLMPRQEFVLEQQRELDSLLNALEDHEGWGEPWPAP